MAGQKLVRLPSLMQRRQLLLAKSDQQRKGTKFGEMVGSTTAECAAVCCCCPLTVMNLVVLAVYRVPVGLCKKAWRKQCKRRRVAKRKQVGGLLMGPSTGGPNAEEKITQTKELLAAANVDYDDAMAELEKEMWERFNGAGFWRSGTQRENETTPSLSTTLK